MKRAWRRFDLAMWQLPVRARKIVIAPVALALASYDFVTEGWGHAVPAFQNAWRVAMEHVEDGPA